MNSKRRIVESVILSALFCLVTQVNAATPWLHTDANTIRDPQGNIVVLRGVDTIDIGAVELQRGGLINLIDRVTDKNNIEGNSPGWYTKVIRLAVYPSDEEDFSSPFTFTPGSDTYYNTLLRPVVDYCKTKDIYAIIDWHYVGNNTYDKVSQTSAFWAYMAPKFANDSHVLFELFNEPLNTSGATDTDDWLSCLPDMQTWVNIIRATAPNNLILVGGPSWSQEIGPAATYPLAADNIVMVAHIYPGHWLNIQNQGWYLTHIDDCLHFYPVFMSEWGFWMGGTNTNLQGTIANYGQPLWDWREERKISSSAWVSDYSWQPPMFNSNWSLRVGPNEMGGFTKDMLYTYRNNDQPQEGDAIPPAPPTGVDTMQLDKKVRVYWNDNSESDFYGYDIYRSKTQGGPYSKINLFRSKDYYYDDANISGSTTYYYVLTAIDTSFNSSGYSDEVSITTPVDTTPPALPTGLSATAGNQTVSLDWNNNSEYDINGYNVYRSLTSGSGYAKLNSTLLSDSAYTDNSVSNGTTYYYVVTAVDTSSNQSGYSSQVSATPHIIIDVNILGSWVTGTTHAKENGANRALVLVAHAKGAGSTADITNATYGGRPMSKIIYRRQGSSTSRVYVAAFILNDANIVAADSGGNFNVTWSATPTSYTYTSVFLRNVNQTTLFGADANNGVTGTSVSTAALSADSGDMVIESAASSIAGTYTVTTGWTKDVDLGVTGYDGMNGHKIAAGVSETPSITQASGNHALIGYVVKAGAPTDLPPAAPTGLTTTGGVGTITLDWNDNAEPDLNGYNVYRSTTSGSGYSKLNSSLVSNSNYPDNNVAIGTPYYYVVTAVDANNNQSGYSNQASATANAAAIGAGAALSEWWTGIPGADVNDLTSNVNYPDNPTGRELLTKLEGPVNWDDNYGARIRGYLHPVADGDYTFWIASDANSELWLSTDGDKANAVRIANVPGFTDSRQWDKYPEQQSAAIPLIGGQKYYIEVLHKADVGNDNVAVAWQGSGITQQVIDGLYLSPCCLKFADFAGLAGQWDRNDCNTGNDWCNGFDFNRNGLVSIADLKAFAESWLAGM